MPVATSMAALTAMIVEAARGAMEVAKGQIMSVMEKEVNSYYVGSPVLYPRTDNLRNSPRTSGISGGGNTLTFDAYLEKGSYAGVNSYLRGLGFVSRLEADEVFEITEAGDSSWHILGNGGYWARSEAQMQEKLDSAMAAVF